VHSSKKAGMSRNMLKRMFVVCLSVVMSYGLSLAASGGAMNWQWNFETGTAKQPPTGFTFSRTASGRQGLWAIKQDEQAPSGRNVLAQLDTDNTSYRFPVAVANKPLLRDLRLSVRSINAQLMPAAIGYLTTPACQLVPLLP
jgi:hypothetical protein